MSTVKRNKGRLERAPAALPAPRRLDDLLSELRSMTKGAK
jgi:hypothetical protein